MNDKGYELGNGMVMTLARITSVSPRPDNFLRFRIQAPLITRMRPRGLAPVFKIFTARNAGAPVTLPTFDEHRLAVPSWESDPARPIARAYTALEFAPGTDSITFDALDLGASGSWIHRAKVGDTVGAIGFKHELVLDENTETLVIMGDRSARPAITEILRATPADLRTTVIDMDASGDTENALRAALAEADERTTVWIAGEVRRVAAGREAALAHGITPTRVLSLPYWHEGLGREHYDRILYRRYERAAAAGLPISNEETAARIELTPVSTAELQSS
ncbi:siderophore-interacting protein [Spirillospora sp. NPDC052242]